MDDNLSRDPLEAGENGTESIGTSWSNSSGGWCHVHVGDTNQRAKKKEVILFHHGFHGRIYECCAQIVVTQLYQVRLLKV